MATRFSFEQRFAAPLEAVEAAFLDPAVVQRMAALPDLGRPELLDVVGEGDVVRRRVRFTFTGQLSKAALAVLDPAKLTWVEESVLDRRTHQSEVRIRPEHYADRLSCSAVVRLVPADGASGVTVRQTEGSLSVRAPLVAGRVERAIVTGLQENAAAEEAIVQEWLSRAGP